MDELVGDTHANAQDKLSFRDAPVREVLKNKKSGGEVMYVQDEDYVLHAIRMMSNSKIGAILVKDTDGNVTGIFTERDYLNKIALKGKSSSSTKMRDVMTTGLYCVSDKASVLKCMEIMTTHKFRHLPVMDMSNNELLGLLSIGDLVKTVNDQYKDTVSFLRDFIEHSY